MSQNLSSKLEIVSAIAVVVSLIFVGFEIRNSSEQVAQNTETMQISAYQDLIARIVEINAIGIEEGETIEGLVAIEDPTFEETERLNSYLWILFRHGDMAYFQFERGAIDDERLRSVNTPLRARLRYPKVIARWNEIEHAFVPQYRNYVRQQIDLVNDSDA